MTGFSRTVPRYPASAPGMEEPDETDAAAVLAPVGSPVILQSHALRTGTYESPARLDSN